MSSYIFDPDESYATDVSSDSICAISNQVVESHGGENGTCSFEKIVSLAKLLQNFQCIKECGGCYMTMPLAASEKWESLFKFARSVTTLELDRDEVQEANQIPPSVFLRLALQLKGEHLFPNLSTVELKNFDISVHYFPLLLSPCLEEISVEFASSKQSEEAAIAPSPPCERMINSWELSLSLLLDDLVSASQALQSLKLKNIPGITRLTLDTVSRFHHLRVLELTNFINVKGFTDFDFLDSFPTLDDLSIVAKGRHYVCLDSPCPREACLPSLKCLRFAGPLGMLSDLLQTITSVNLLQLTFNHEPGSIFKTTTKVSNMKKTKRRHVPARPSGSLVEILFSRWQQTLKELVIVSPNALSCGLNYVARLHVLENVYIQGCSMSGISQAFDETSGFRNSLHTLCLTEAPVPLELLKQIAENAPSLITLSLSLDITDAADGNEIRATKTNHPLESLEIHHAAAHQPKTDSDNFLLLVGMARYLNILFPNIRKLTASTRESEWEKVWQLVKLCQESRSRQAEKSGSKVVGGENFEVI